MIVHVHEFITELWWHKMRAVKRSPILIETPDIAFVMAKIARGKR